MMLVNMGPLCIRVPGEHRLPALCRRNADGSNFVVEFHAHSKPHVTTFFGRWKLTIKMPFKKDGEIVGYTEIDKMIVGNGPDSFQLIEAGIEHRLEMLDASGFYACNFGHYTADDLPSGEYTGNLLATV